MKQLVDIFEMETELEVNMNESTETLMNVLTAMRHGNHEEANKQFSSYITEKTKSILNEITRDDINILPSSIRTRLKGGARMLDQEEIDNIHSDDLTDILSDLNKIDIPPSNIRVMKRRMHNSLRNRDEDGNLISHSSNDYDRDDDFDDEPDYYPDEGPMNYSPGMG